MLLVKVKWEIFSHFPSKQTNSLWLSLISMMWSLVTGGPRVHDCQYQLCLMVMIRWATGGQLMTSCQLWSSPLTSTCYQLDYFREYILVIVTSTHKDQPPIFRDYPGYISQNKIYLECFQREASFDRSNWNANELILCCFSSICPLDPAFHPIVMIVECSTDKLQHKNNKCWVEFAVEDHNSTFVNKVSSRWYKYFLSRFHGSQGTRIFKSKSLTDVVATLVRWESKDGDIRLSHVLCMIREPEIFPIPTSSFPCFLPASHHTSQGALPNRPTVNWLWLRLQVVSEEEN